MMRRRHKRKTDWLFADTVVTQTSLSPGAGLSDVTIPILPTEYIDELAEGTCTLLRIVGDFYIYAITPESTTTSVGPGNPLGVSCGLLRTQLDDSGVASQLEVNMFGPPALGPSSNVGGGRDFLWIRNFLWTGPILPNNGTPPIFGGGSVPRGYEQANFDLRVKRRLTTGEALVFQKNVTLGTPESSATIDVFTIFSYRILVGLTRR